jgi:hypothetical protein
MRTLRGGADGMKILPEQFESKGFLHRQIQRVGDVALFERSKPTHTNPHFEVVKIGRHNGYKIAGQLIAPAETYPPSTQWGSKGWTFTDRDDAWKRFRELTEKPQKQATKAEEVES